MLDQLSWLSDREQVAAILMDAEMCPIRIDFIGVGDGASTSVFARHLLALALAGDARAVILAHNHPSGLNQPSRADHRVTSALARLLRAVDIILVDHLILGRSWLSMREEGLL